MKFFLPILLVTLLSTTTWANDPKWQAGNVYTFKSKLFTWAFYEDTTQTLILGKSTGNATEYYRVPKGVFDDFMNTRIKGSIFAGRIKNKYSSDKVWKKQAPK